MANTTFSPFPLDEVTDADLQNFCRAAWDWDFCVFCDNGQNCQGAPCPRQRWGRLEPFFEYYRTVTASYVPELSLDAPEAITSHKEICDLILHIRQNASVPRSQVTEAFFTKRRSHDGQVPAAEDQDRAINLAMKLMTMISCTTETQAGGLLESGVQPSIWRGDKSLADFFTLTFPMRDHPSLNDSEESAIDIKTQLTAKKLKKVAGLKFRGVDDIRNHLKLDQTTGILDIYHHTAVLKEHLMASKEKAPRGPTVLESFRYVDLLLVSKYWLMRTHHSGCIPRQLALETLDSLQKILFPLEPDSQAILRSLVSKQSLDPDCLRFGSMPYRTEAEKDIEYQYWGSRIMDLYDEIENPKPRGFLETWLEQRSKARHVMLATLIGVMIAIVLGFFALVVAIIQTWVAYQAWKYPLQPGGTQV